MTVHWLPGAPEQIILHEMTRLGFSGLIALAALGHLQTWRERRARRGRCAMMRDLYVRISDMRVAELRAEVKRRREVGEREHMAELECVADTLDKATPA